MKPTLTALLGTAAIANGTIVHLFENEDITLRLTVENSVQIDDTRERFKEVNGAKMKLEVLSTAEDVRLNSVYYRMNNGSLTGVSNWQRDTLPGEFLTEGVTTIRSFDLDTDDFNNSISPDPNPFGDNRSNPAFRPHLYSDEGRGSYNFTDQRQLLWDVDAENLEWFDENVDGGDQWFVYHDEFRNGSGSIGEWSFDQPMSVVYSKSKGSTTESYALGNFTEIYKFDGPGVLQDDPAVPEPSSALLTLLASLMVITKRSR
jgi:hypothetical protein